MNFKIFNTLVLTLFLTLLTGTTLANPSPNPDPDPDAEVSTDWLNAIKCGSKNPAINTAIDAFCSNSFKWTELNNVVVPSRFARAGRKTQGVHVKIVGHCAPAQWVPMEWCAVQFHEICANSREHGFGSYRYGEDGCQQWIIQRA